MTIEKRTKELVIEIPASITPMGTYSLGVQEATCCLRPDRSRVWRETALHRRVGSI
jgi:hypothetical protein